MKIRRNLINEAERDLNSNTSKIDLKQLEFVYNQATSQVSGIQKTFEEMVAFHNRMITEKVKYIIKDLPKLDAEINDKSAHLKRLLQENEDLASSISCSESFEELEKNSSVSLKPKFKKKQDAWLRLVE